MKIKGKLLSAFLIITIFFTIISAVTIFISITNNSIITNSKETILNNTIKAVELQTDIIQIQQLFTDISVIRGKTEYDDGLTKAESVYNSAMYKIDHFMQIPENSVNIEKMETIKELLVLLR